MNTATPAEFAFYPHEIDHVVAEKYGGATNLNNLAFSCWRCNRHKGSDLPPSTRRQGDSALFSTHGLQSAAEHFAYEVERIVDLTSEGRTTVNQLRLNSEERLME